MTTRSQFSGGESDTGPQPFLRWAGSKRKSLHRLKRYWRRGGGKYIEPFAGSASLFFSLNPPRAVLSDINGDLIHALRWVRKSPNEVFASLRPRPVRSDYYYALRKQDPRQLAGAKQAARFIFLNRFCFNGLYRTNLRGLFNVPFAGAKTGKKPTRHHLLECSRTLRHATLEMGDFEAVVRRHTAKGDFVYLDPPYATQSRRIFGEYDADSFTIDDLPRLAELLDEIASRQATFVLSYAYCPEALKVLSNWTSKKLFVQRNIAGFVGRRRMAAEVIITNGLPE